MVGMADLGMVALVGGLGVGIALVLLIWSRQEAIAPDGRAGPFLLAGMAFVASFTILLLSALWEGSLPPLALASLAVEICALGILVKAFAGGRRASSPAQAELPRGQL